MHLKAQIYGKNNFVEISKNLTRYKSENNFAKLSKKLCMKHNNTRKRFDNQFERTT